MARRRRNFYKVLGADPSFSQDELKRRFRQLAMQYHPDRNPDDPEATERMKELTGAWDVLGDPEKRAQYDLALARRAQARVARRRQSEPEGENGDGCGCGILELALMIFVFYLISQFFSWLGNEVSHFFFWLGHLL